MTEKDQTAFTGVDITKNQPMTEEDQTSPTKVDIKEINQ
jgi:hypothetical protein